MDQRMSWFREFGDRIEPRQAMFAIADLPQWAEDDKDAWQWVAASTIPGAMSKVEVARGVTGHLIDSLYLSRAVEKSLSVVIGEVMPQFFADPTSSLSAVTLTKRRCMHNWNDGKQRAQRPAAPIRLGSCHTWAGELKQWSSVVPFDTTLLSLPSMYVEVEKPELWLVPLARSYSRLPAEEYRIIVASGDTCPQRLTAGISPVLADQSCICRGVINAPLLTFWKVSGAGLVTAYSLEMDPGEKLTVGQRIAYRSLEQQLDSSPENRPALMKALLDGGPL